MPEPSQFKTTLSKIFGLNVTSEQVAKILDIIDMDPSILGYEVMTKEEVSDYYGTENVIVVNGQASIVTKIRDYGSRLKEGDDGGAALVLEQIKGLLDELV